MAKKRGLDMKFYRRSTLLTAAITDTPALSGSGWQEIKTVNNVEHSITANETTIETRESEDDFVLASGRTSEVTVRIPVDLADGHYIALVQASNAQSEIALLFATDALTTSGANNDVRAGNYVVTEETSSEAKKEGVIAAFKCKPSSFYARIIKPVAS